MTASPKTVRGIILVLLAAVVGASSAALFQIQRKIPVNRHSAHGLSFNERTEKLAPPADLRVRVIPDGVKLAKPAKVVVSLTNVGAESFYITTSLDPFVGGRALLRNFYITLAGGCEPIPIQRMFIDSSISTLTEAQLLAANAIVLLKPGQTFNGLMPLDEWRDLVSKPGNCSIQVHYSGTAPDGSFSHPFLSDAIESFPAEFRVLD